MEKARQHSALSWEMQLFALLFFGGLFVMIAGIAAQFIIGGQSILIGLTTYLMSRVGMRALMLARPDAFPGERTHWIWSVVGIVLLLTVCVFLVMLGQGSIK